MTMALDGLVVLDLSHALAGPLATAQLGDFGADVIKIETPGSGDIARAWGPPFYGSEPAYFLSVNRNKRSVELDLKHPEGRELFFRLAEQADVVIENFRVGTVEKLGVDYQRVRARNPRIVYCSISGFGQTGPYKDRAAMDLIAQAESGLISVTGEEGSHGVRCGISIADITAGMNAAFGVLTALRARDLTGEGQFVDVSLLEGQLGLLDVLIGYYLADGEVPKPMGTSYKNLLPYQTFRTRTKDIAVAIGSDSLWRIFCPLLGLPQLVADPRYRNNAARAANRATLVATLQEALLAKSYAEWESILLPAGIPFGAINSIAEVVEHPQVKARGVLVEYEHPIAGKVKLVGPRVRLSETPGGVRRPAPLLGQHTDEVLKERLGLGQEEVLRLRRAGAIGKQR